MRLSTGRSSRLIAADQRCTRPRAEVAWRGRGVSRETARRVAAPAVTPVARVDPRPKSFVFPAPWQAPVQTPPPDQEPSPRLNPTTHPRVFLVRSDGNGRRSGLRNFAEITRSKATIPHRAALCRGPLARGAAPFCRRGCPPSSSRPALRGPGAHSAVEWGVQEGDVGGTPSGVARAASDAARRNPGTRPGERECGSSG